MTQPPTLTRRTFLKRAGMTAASIPVLTSRSYSRLGGANERFNVAIIGCGGIAQSHLNALLQMPEAVEIAAIVS